MPPTIATRRPRRLPPLVALLVALLPFALGGHGAAQDDIRVDPATGRDLAHWPPDRHFDHLHMRLEIEIPDMGVPFFRARCMLAVSPIGRPRDNLRLDALGLGIGGVSLGGRPQSFSYDGEELVVRFERPVALGERAEVVIDYTLDYPGGGGVGLTWTPGDANAENATDAAPQIHTQGQPEHNRRWFPCHDFPNERLTTELIVTVPSGFDVCSNGRLVGTGQSETARHRDSGTGGAPPLGTSAPRHLDTSDLGTEDSAPTTTFHFLQDKPHAPYLVSLVVGKFEIVDLEGAPPDIPMRVYAPDGAGDHVRNTFGRTPEMVAHFSRLFDEPYPWDKYDQVIVRNFFAGAMENTSASTFHASYATLPRGAVEPTIVHELVHQWFGDLVTYKSWEHTWLGEGWATYGEALWAEADAREGRSRSAYLRAVRGLLARQAGNRGHAPDYPAMASNYYPSAEMNFFKPDDVYAKGGLVLHMLRARLGDELFFRAVALYLDRYRFREVETDDFRRVLEEVSGDSLELFFDQWVRRPGLPRLDVTAAWDESAGVLRTTVRQVQHIDADNPAYAFTLPLLVRLESGARRTYYLATDTREAEAVFPLDGRPADVVVDPGITVAAHKRVSKDLGRGLEEEPEEEDQPAGAAPAEESGD